MAISSRSRLLRYLNRREALKTLGLGATALAFAGCDVMVGPPPLTLSSLGKDPAPGRKTVIEMYSNFGSSNAVGWIKLATRYEQVQPDVGVKITYAPIPDNTGQDNPKLFTAVAGNTSPDLAHLTPFSTPQWVELGVMTDLTHYMQRDGLGEDDFFPVAWHDMNYKGSVWQVQWDADANFPFFWNKDLFQQVGLDPNRPPQTFDEVDEVSRKILQKSHGNVTRIGLVPWNTYGFANSMFTWGWAFGGEFYDPVKQEVTPDNDYVVKALEWMVNYAKSVGGADNVDVSPPSLQLDPFLAGDVGMSPLVSPNLRDLKTTNPGMHFGATMLPYQGPGATKPGQGAWFGGWSLFIPSGAKHPDEAWDFIKWVAASDEGTRAQWEAIGLPPAYRKASVLDTIKNDPIMGPYYSVLISAQHSRPAIPVGAYYASQLEALVSNAVYGKATPIQVLRAIKANTMQEWERFKREFDI